MREVKFRAWDSEANIMVYSDHRTRKLYDVYYGFEMNESGLLECRWEGDFTESHVLDGGTLDNIMQYTGLKDKNSKEIYEGDILEVYDRKGENPIANVEVYWNNGYWDAKDSRDDCFRSCYAGFSKNKIIGNVHENPELIK